MPLSGRRCKVRRVITQRYQQMNQTRLLRKSRFLYNKSRRGDSHEKRTSDRRRIFRHLADGFPLRMQWICRVRAGSRRRHKSIIAARQQRTASAGRRIGGEADGHIRFSPTGDSDHAHRGELRRRYEDFRGHRRPRFWRLRAADLPGGHRLLEWGYPGRAAAHLVQPHRPRQNSGDRKHHESPCPGRGNHLL